MTNPSDYQIKKANYAFVKKLMKEPLLERDEENQLAKNWSEKHDEMSLHKLVQSYYRLVVSIAMRFKHYGIPMNDLIQEGNLGLMEAAKRFDPHREVRFSTYSKWWVRATIQDFVLRNWSIVRTGSTTAQKQLFFNLNRLRNELLKFNQDAFSNEDRQKIADILKVTMSDVSDMESRLAQHDISLNAPIFDDYEGKWEDRLTDDQPTPEDQTIENHDLTIKQHWIGQALKSLTERERVIILSRRLSDPPLTLEDVGKKIGISKERVRQLEIRALRKMRYQLTINKKRPMDAGS